MTERCRRIAIIGAGFTGTALALALLRGCRGPVAITLIDRRGKFGPGLAYATARPEHRLNVCAGRMSLYDDEPDHFVTWLSRCGEFRAMDRACLAAAYLPRAVYGRYIEAALREAIAAAPPDTRLDLVAEEAVGVDLPARHVRVALRSGRTIDADRAVLCPGNFAPAPLACLGCDPAATTRIIGDPWAPGALSPIARGDSVVFLGTGLTAIDIVLSLRAQGHRGPLCAISRHGLLPQAHRRGLPSPMSLALPQTPPRNARAQLRWLRTAIAEAAQHGVDWRCVVDALRYDATRFWQALPPREKARFLRHLRSYWDVHRHRMAPEIAAQIDALMRSGELVIAAGRLISVIPASEGLRLGVRARHERGVTELRADWIINCTGPACRFDDGGEPLLRSLIDSGTARVDSLQLGIETAGEGRLVGADGRASTCLFALGTAVRGRFWEITSVPDLRRHCHTLAASLSEGLAASREEAGFGRVAAPPRPAIAQPAGQSR